MSKSPTTFDFWYAVRNTEVIVPPKRHLETFGNTIINYVLVCELMDSVQQVRVREGRMQALRPQIVTPEAYSEMILEGFGEQAEKYLEWLREHEDGVHVLQYGYSLKQEAFSEEIVNDGIENVLGRVKKDVAARGDPLSAVVKGVDTPWDVCLVRLFWLAIRNEEASAFYTTDLLTRMFEAEGRGAFSVRGVVLGHVQQGGIPTPFDRINGVRLAAQVTDWMTEALASGEAVHGFTTPEGVRSVRDLDDLVDWDVRRPKEQWWMVLKPVLSALGSRPTA